MNQYTAKDFIKLLKKNSQGIRHDLLEEGTNCMRVYDRHQGDFPITVDLYSDFARIVDYGEEPLDEETKQFCIDSVSRMLYVPAENIVYTLRSKRVGKEQHEKNLDSVRTTVREGGLEFEVELASYTDTGLFLDHYRTRQMIREMAVGMDVLNLFSYTGSFSVYAAAGLAKTVTSVDLSSTYSKWAEENLKRNGYSGSNYSCICMDASKFIDKCIENGAKYNLIIFDPPSFSNSHKMDDDFDVGKDGIDWIRKLTRLLRKDGVILFSTNLGSFRMDKRRLKGLSVQEITDRVKAPGFVKNRKGAVRSWIMTLDDNSLNLDWSEEGSKQKEQREPKKEFGKNEYKPERRNYGSDRKREYGHSERRYSDKPRRDFDRSDRPRRSDRSFDREDRPARRDFNSDRPQRSYSERRHYDGEAERRPRYSDSYSERPKRDYERSDDRPRRSSGRSFDREDRPSRRDFNSDRPQRSFSERRYSDRPKREFDREERPRREFNREERPRREFDSERPRYAKTERRSTSPKPYGYDSFKPARSRNDDDPDLFWN